MERHTKRRSPVRIPVKYNTFTRAAFRSAKGQRIFCPGFLYLMTSANRSTDPGKNTREYKLLRQGYRYFKLRKAFSKFYHRHSALLEKYSVSLKTLLQQGISEPEFKVTVYRFRKIVGKSNFSEQFRKLINRYKRIGYSLDIMRQTACLDVNSIIVNGYASLFNCTTAVRASDSMTASS